MLPLKGHVLKYLEVKGHDVGNLVSDGSTNLFICVETEFTQKWKISKHWWLWRKKKKEFNKKLWIYEKLGTVTHKEEKNSSIKTDTNGKNSGINKKQSYKEQI